MSSADRDDVLARELIERLLINPGFRAEFRRDPAAACLTAGLPDLAAELSASPGSMDTLVVRESRSSLAGVVMAVAVEGIGVAEAKALMHHGLTGAPHGLKLPHGSGLKLPHGSGLKLPHGSGLRNPLGHAGHVPSSGALQRELRGLGAGSRADAVGGPAGNGSAAPFASSVSSAPPGSSAAPASSASPVSSGSSTAAASAPPPSSTPPANGAGTPPATAEPTPPNPGAQPIDGGAVPAWPDQQPGAGGAVGGAAGGTAAVGAGGPGGGLMALLDSPRLSASPNVRTFLASGSVDPRMVSVLDSALANHTIGLGQLEAVSDPVHVQAVDIVSVDGQPVGPGNFAARDLVTEIAALDPSLRPTEIGTPWPIHSPGFYSDPAQPGQLHLAFVSSSDYQPPGTNVLEPGSASAPVDATAPAVAPAAAEPATAAPAAGIDPADVPSPAPSTPPPPTSGGGYVNPLPDSARIGRTDMGVDANMNPGDPIVAPGTSRVLGITPNWYRGQPYVGLQLLDGPMKGHNYYLAEQITPNVSVGQIVQQGQPIAHYAASGTGIEMGWAGANWEQTLAQATSGYSEGEQTSAGASFRNFLDNLGHHGTSASSAPGPAVPDPDATAGPDPDANAGPDPDANAGPDPDANAGPDRDASAGPGPEAAPAAPPSVALPEAAPPPNPVDAASRPPAPFTVLESRHRGTPRHTVQFLPAVQPSPGSPLYGQAPPRVPVEAPVAQQVAQTPTAPGVPQAPASGALVDQASATLPGGSISVSSSLLTPGQAKFAGRLAELTGLDPHVVAAWELAEESGSAAQGREAASNFNWLNIGYFDSGAGRIAFDKTFGDPISAAEQSAKFLKGEWGGASSSIRAILNSVGHSPDDQIAAIANSDWASSHYGGGANLHGTYNELGDIHIEKSSTA